MPLRLLLVTFLALFLFSCSDDDDALSTFDGPDEVTGLSYVTAGPGDSPEEVYNRLLSALSGNDQITVVAEVDHAANAASINQSLRPTRVVLFGNPALGTPLMQINPQAGLDLPQKMLVYQSEDDTVVVAYNAAEYLAARHGVGEAETLSKISEALAGLAATAAGGSQPRAAGDDSVALNEGVVRILGPGSVDSVYMRLKEAITANADIKLVAEVDHQANAASVGMELPPIRLIVFGNPQLGTPLMLDGQHVGIDLPQKMLVYQAGDGEVVVAYNDPAFLADRHDVDAETLATIREALEGLAHQALNH